MAIISLYLNLYVLVSDLGVGTAFVASRLSYSDVNRIVIPVLITSSIFAAIMSICGYFYVDSLVYGDLNHDREYFWIAVFLSMLVSASGQLVYCVLDKKKEFKTVLYLEVIGSIFSLMIVVLFIYYSYGIYGYLLSSIGQTFIAIIFSVKVFSLNNFIVGRFYDYKVLLRRGVWIILSNTANRLSANLDVLFLAKFTNTEIVALYTLPKNLSLRLQNVSISAVNRVFLPEFSSGDTRAIKKIIKKQVEFVSIYVLPVCVVISILSEDIIRVLFGEKWLAAGDVLSVVVFVTAYKLMHSFTLPIMYALNYQKAAFTWNLSWITISLPIIFYSAYSGEIFWLALTSLFVSILQYVSIYFYILRPKIALAPKDYFYVPAKVLLVIMMVYFLSVYLIETFLNYMTYNSFILAVVFIVFYALYLAIFETKSILELLRKF